MSLAFSSRSSCSRRTKGGAAANHLAYNDYNNYNNFEEKVHATPEEIAHTNELMSLQREYLSSFNIKPDQSNSNSYNTHSNIYKAYKAKYARDPVHNAELYSLNVYPKLHSGKVRNLNAIKHTSKRKILQPNPIKRLFGRNRNRTRRNRNRNRKN